jgi:hypothetical protein
MVYEPVEEDWKLKTCDAMSASFIGVLALFPELSQLASLAFTKLAGLSYFNTPTTQRFRNMPT